MKKHFSISFEYSHEVAKFLDECEENTEIVAITQCCTGYTVFYKYKTL